MSSSIHREIIDKKINELSLNLDCLKQTPVWYPPKIWRVVNRSKSQIFEIYDLIGKLGIFQQFSIFDEFENILLSIIESIGFVGFWGAIWILYSLLYEKIAAFFTKKLVIFGITIWQQQPFWLIGAVGAIIIIFLCIVFLSWLAKKFWIYRLSSRLDNIKKQQEKEVLS